MASCSNKKFLILHLALILDPCSPFLAAGNPLITWWDYLIFYRIVLPLAQPIVADPAFTSVNVIPNDF